MKQASSAPKFTSYVLYFTLHSRTCVGNISPPSLHETSQDSNSAQRLGGMAKRQYHLAIISHLLSGSAEQQLDRVEEVLWQLEIVRDYERLGSILFTPQ